MNVERTASSWRYKKTKHKSDVVTGNPKSSSLAVCFRKSSTKKKKKTSHIFYLWKASSSFFTLRSRERTFPNTHTRAFLPTVGLWQFHIVGPIPWQLKSSRIKRGPHNQIGLNYKFVNTKLLLKMCYNSSYRIFFTL